MSARPRPPAVAGQFYEADGTRLARQIEACFTSDRGPGELPPPRRSAERHIRAAVVPHAGYQYSGPIAALAYAAIAAERPPASVLILGVDHHATGASATVSDRDWTTPLGPVEVDHELVGVLARGPIRVEEARHAAEHSIEVQLPFLQYVLPRPRFAAVMIPFASLDALHAVAEVVGSAVAGRDVLLLASTDFSHYLPVEETRRADQMAIDAILKRDAAGLYGTVTRHDISMCGIAPTTVLLDALASEPLDARLLRWGHSGEAEPMDRVVGYASFLLSSRTPLGPSVR